MPVPRGSPDSGKDRTQTESALLAAGFKPQGTHCATRAEFRKIIDQGPDGKVLVDVTWATEHNAYVTDRAGGKEYVHARWFASAFNPYGRELSSDRKNLQALCNAELGAIFDFKEPTENDRNRFCFQARRISEFWEAKVG